MSFLTESEAIKNADAGVKARILLERRIAVSAVEELLSHGFLIIIDNGEDETNALSDRDAILSAMSETDEDYLIVVKDNQRIGELRFIYGNDGFDVLSDYSSKMDQYIQKTNKLIESLG